MVLHHDISIFGLIMNIYMKATYLCTCETDFRLIKVIKQFIYRFKNRSKLKIVNRVPLYET